MGGEYGGKTQLKKKQKTKNKKQKTIGVFNVGRNQNQNLIVTGI